MSIASAGRAAPAVQEPASHSSCRSRSSRCARSPGGSGIPNSSLRPVSPLAARLAAHAPGGSAPATGRALADGQAAQPPDTSQAGAGAGDEREAGAEAGEEAGPSRGNGTAAAAGSAGFAGFAGFTGSAGGSRSAVAACPNPV